MSTEYQYFIIPGIPDNFSRVKAGSLCYMKVFKYKTIQQQSPPPERVAVFFLRSRTLLDYDVKLSSLEPLSVEDAELLQALDNDCERLKWFREEKALQTARGLSVGAEVTVEHERKELKGIIRYIGRMTESHYSNLISGTFFGIELQGKHRGMGHTDGRYRLRKLFQCDQNCGVFAPFTRVKPLLPSSWSSPIPKSSPELQTGELKYGDRVTYFPDNKCRYGSVVDVQERDGQHFVLIATDKDETGKEGSLIEVPLDQVAKGEVPTEPESMDVDTVTNSDDLYTDLTVNSMVEVTLAHSSNAHGIIRWIGSLPDRKETMAGLELEEMVGVSDGTIKGYRYFFCPPKKALFVKLSSCRPDSRFQNISTNHNEKFPNPEDTESDLDDGTTGNPETVPPVSTEQVKELLIGRMKGIQGHCNSCYMDAALFGLFSCSSVLDSLLFKSTTPQDAPIQKTLLKNIVNPLRSKGFVEGRHVMKLRQQLRKHGYSHSFTTDEKDPEEFLIVIMHHILALDPLLKLSSAGKVQESYCYQIFLDQNHSLVLPTVQQLLEHSLHSAMLKLAEVPSCLILQMPRFGKKFKMFDKIIPSLELDITDLLSEGPQQCVLCGSLAVQECPDCFKDSIFSPTGFKVFCEICAAQVHSHPQRLSHKPSPLNFPKDYVGHSIPRSLARDKLELFAVLCIETSHYVSFVKHGPNSHDWIFFDSMSDREGESDGFNIPEVTPCPEVGTYLEMSPTEMANQVPREMKGVAKRLFCDAYMYLYQSTSMCLYR